jgi:hypothetical protein
MQLEVEGAISLSSWASVFAQAKSLSRACRGNLGERREVPRFLRRNNRAFGSLPYIN